MMYLQGIAVALITLAFSVLYFQQKPTSLPENSLAGHRVVITGCSAGIGEALAYDYARQGASVFITARREGLLKQVIAKCREIGHPDAIFGYYVADFIDFKVQSKLFIEAAVKTLQGIDTILVNHMYWPQLQVWIGSEQDLQVSDDMLDANVKGCIHIISHALPHIRQSHKPGRIGVIGSLLGKIPTPTFLPYCTCKYAIDGFMSTLRMELEQSGSDITVTYAALSQINSDLYKHFFPNEISRINFGNLSDFLDAPMLAPSSPEEAARAVMVAIQIGSDELYFRALYKTRYITAPSWMMPILRHVYSPLIEWLRFSEEFYENYMKHMSD